MGRGGRGDVKNKTIGILGLAFKPNTDDMREAPSVDIIPWLIDEGACVKAYDPVAEEHARKVLPKETVFTKSPYDTADDCDVLVVLTEWNEFRDLDLEDVRARMNKPVMIDAKNIYTPRVVRETGFTYESIGR